MRNIGTGNLSHGVRLFPQIIFRGSFIWKPVPFGRRNLLHYTRFFSLFAALKVSDLPVISFTASKTCHKLRRRMHVLELGVLFLFPTLIRSYLSSVSFGDSLTDDGISSKSVRHPDNHGFKRFCNGPIWTEYLLESLRTPETRYRNTKSIFRFLTYIGI